ncbi:hypothetical protein TrST_g1893 [Triparma strigata]|uniref:Uncharacterized protein n=1 Tax=Triparma strigata TaxID=1606541 RepID=A0A9W7BU07_9STRA|nr:hypothetical protein TrST_g1893 [Triparma strigata]
MTVRFLVSLLIALLCFTSSKADKVSLLPSPETSSVFMSSFATAALLYPLDLLRSLSMTSPGTPVPKLVGDFYKDFGAKGFVSQGLAPEVSRATVMRGVKFALYPRFHRRLFSGKDPHEGTTATKIAAAAATSVPEVLLIMPLEVSKILLTTDKTNKYGNSMIKALARTSPKKYMTGYLGVQYRQMSWGCGYFSTIGPYRKLVDKVAGGEETSNAALKSLVSGFAAGVTGAILNTPGDTVRSVVMKRNLVEGVPASFFPVAREIVREKGAGSLYAGFGAKAAHLGGGGALMALFTPMARGWCERRMAGGGG